MNQTEERWLYYLDDEVIQAILQVEPNLAELAPGIRHKAGSSAGVTKAVAAALEGRRDEALAELRRVTQAADAETDALAFHAYLEVERGQFAEAASLYQRAIAQEKDAKANYYNLGICLYKLERWKEAADAFAKAKDLDRQPARAEFLVALGVCHLHLFEPQQAIAYFDAVLVRQPDQPEALLGKGTAFQYLRDHASAERIYTQLDPCLEPDSPLLRTLLLNRLTLASTRQDVPPDEALIRDLAVRLMNFEEPTARLAAQEALANLSFLREKFTEAAKFCERIVDLAPSSAEAWFNLGVARHHLGQQRPAMEAYLQAIEIDPNLMQAQANLGMLYHQRGELEQARRCYVESLHQDPSLAETLWNLGILLEQGGHQTEAAVCYEQLAQLTPDWEDPWFRLASGHLDAARWQQAAEGFERCLQLRHDWVDAARGLALAKAHLGQEQMAVDLLERVSQLDRSPEVAFNLGVLHDKNGRSDRAIECYRQALERKSDYPEALLNLGHCLKKTGQEEEAQGLWRQAVRLKPVYAAEYFG